MAEIKLNVQGIRENASSLHAGDNVLLSGVVYTARDAAHKRIFQVLNDGGELPFEIQDSCVYYCGPTPAPDGLPIGSCGPTTSGRMDPYAPRLLDLGMVAMIGKGERSREVNDAIVRNKAVYFCAIGGAGALAAKCIQNCEVIGFDDLGCESVKRIILKDFPVIVATDCHGATLFK